MLDSCMAVLASHCACRPLGLQVTGLLGPEFVDRSIGLDQKLGDAS